MHNATLSFWFLPVFIVGWLAISFLLGVISGWHRLGKVYRRPEGARPTTVAQFQSIHMKLVGYRSCVTVGVDPAGLFLSVYLPFRFGHPPLLVPWDAIESLGPCNVFGFRYHSVSLRPNADHRHLAPIPRCSADGRISADPWPYGAPIVNSQKDTAL